MQQKPTMISNYRGRYHGSVRLLNATVWQLGALCALLVIAARVDAVEPIPLRAGPLTMVFDVENGSLRYLRVETHEVLRGINAPIRDASWATIAPRVSNLQIEDRGDSFDLSFDVACQQSDIDFRWRGSISGSDQGVVSFRFDGEAHSTFHRNRIGFCVLHGPTAAGQPWLLETADGGTIHGHFPKFVAPHQPAKQLRAVTHEVTAGLQARVDFEGEVFEMEDQRNWTDASFKTYCTPLELPYPVEIARGTKISQKITVRLVGDLPDKAGEHAAHAVLTIGDRTTPLPRLGLQVSAEIENLTDAQVERLQALHLDHLRVHLSLSEPSFVAELRRATRQAQLLGVSLQIGLTLGDAPDFATLLKEIKELQSPVAYWLVTGGDPSAFQAAYEQLMRDAVDTRIGVTRITNFVDLNRARPDNELVQAVGFAINPQIHAFDNESMVETLAMHGEVVKSARQFAGDRHLVIGPITLAPQFVDGKDQPGGPPPGGLLPTYVDARQVEPLTAVWTLGSLKFLADAGARSATYFETVGWNGVMDVVDVSSRPKAFPSKPGEVFPVYRLLRDFGEFAGGQAQQIDCSNELKAVGIALHGAGRMRVLIGNLTPKQQTVTLRGLVDQPLPVEILVAQEDAQEIVATPELSLSLPPYGIARIDRVVK
jgi:hypothetical protein